MYNKSQQWYDDCLESQQLSSNFRKSCWNPKRDSKRIPGKTIPKAEGRESKKVMQARREFNSRELKITKKKCK